MPSMVKPLFVLRLPAILKLMPLPPPPKARLLAPIVSTTPGDRATSDVTVRPYMVRLVTWFAVSDVERSALAVCTGVAADDTRTCSVTVPSSRLRLPRDIIDARRG